MDFTGIYVALVKKHIDLWHGGAVPVDREGYLLELLDDYLPETFQARSRLTPAEFRAERALLEAHIRKAIDAVAMDTLQNTYGLVN